MSESSIPDEVRKFLTEHVRSVAQLEILLLLNASPERCWTAAEVYHAMLSNQDLVQKTLTWLCQRGLAEKIEPGYRVSGSAVHRGIIGQLADLYRERPARVVQAIYETKVSEIEEFAKAFKLRKDQ